MKINLVFMGKEEKVAKNNRPYTRYNTSDGKWYTCFDTKVKEVLDSAVGKDSVVECEVDGNVIKWTEFMTLNPKAENVFPASKISDKNNTMYVSYAKDIFIALLTADAKLNITNKEIMDLSINLIKHAKEAF